MSSDESYFLDPWQTKEVLDPDVETKSYESIIQMVFDHQLPCIGHIILSNYTWKQSDLTRLIPFYSSLGDDFDQNLSKLQQSCEPVSFSAITSKHALLELPIYSKCVDLSQIANESVSRVYHDSKEFIDNGSATEPELLKFVQSVMKNVLEPFFSSKEIKKVLKEPIALIETLATSRRRDEKIGNAPTKKLEYDIARLFIDKSVDFPDFHAKLAYSITNFLAYFALHVIRHHCYVNFGVDGELKFYQREMYRQALEDLRISKSKSAIISNAVNVKPESGKKSMEQPKWTPIRVKPEKKNSDEEDFCEVIETVSANSKSKKLKSPKQEIIVDRLEKQKDSERDVKDFPEKYLLEDLDKDELPMYFKTKFRKLVEQNQMLRDEIKDYKDLIQLKIAEKKQKLK